MKVIAQRGGTSVLLVQTRVVDGMAWGRIWNVNVREMSPEQPVASIARYGYWEQYTGRDMTAADFKGVRLLNPPVKGER